MLKTAGIGDTVILSGAIRSLRDSFPNAEITLFCGQNNSAVGRIIGDLDRVIELPIKSIFGSVKLIRTSGVYDVWLDFGPWPRYNAVLSAIAKTKYTVGFKTKGQFRHFIYDHKILHLEFTSRWHELENYRAIVFSLGEGSKFSPQISIGEVPKKPGQVALHIFPGGSRSYLKEWPIKNWIEIIDFFTEKSYSVVLTGGKGDREPINEIMPILRYPEKVQNLAGVLSLLDTARLLKESELVISVDTGIMHLASAIGCRLIALHGPTSPDRWGPIDGKAIVLKGADCLRSSCIDLGFENVCTTPGKCMASITPQSLIATIQKILLGDR